MKKYDIAKKIYATHTKVQSELLKTSLKINEERKKPMYELYNNPYMKSHIEHLEMNEQFIQDDLNVCKGVLCALYTIYGEKIYQDCVNNLDQLFDDEYLFTRNF